ncbi:MAG: nuclear transport factor 2 family protein [Pseudomonadales bacterium]|jgi:hypothetical protein|nr:nuclear transport factor 2 family protein [Pseudomonadales bacterium]
MDIQKIWSGFVETFDEVVVSSDWSRLEEFLTEDVRYLVSGVPFACELSGRTSVLAGLRRSVDNFDAHFDTRHYEAVASREFPPNLIVSDVWSRYVRSGQEPLQFPVRSSFFFRDDRICLLADCYDADAIELQRAFAWLERNAGPYDPRYTA